MRTITVAEEDPRADPDAGQKREFGGARYGWKMMAGKLVDLLGRIP